MKSSRRPASSVIRYEMIHEARVIPIGDGQHLPPTMRSYMGDARGRWEGQTFVVETTNIRDEIAYRGANAGHAEAGRAVHARRARQGSLGRDG